MRYLAVFTILFLMSGCTSKVAVITLESTITQAALAAQRATNGASNTLSIEVGVTTGYRASAAVPIPVPVVPIDVSASSTTTTKLKLNVDLKSFKPPDRLKGADPDIFILDTKTGLLQKPVP